MDMLAEVIIAWYLVGLIATCASICIFRGKWSGDGDNHKSYYILTKELYSAAIGPLFGPCVILLMLIDLYKNRCYKKRVRENE